jgi:hypothetical protein
MDVLMFQGLGMYGSEVAANARIHVIHGLTEPGSKLPFKTKLPLTVLIR